MMVNRVNYKDKVLKKYLNPKKLMTDKNFYTKTEFEYEGSIPAKVIVWKGGYSRKPKK